MTRYWQLKIALLIIFILALIPISSHQGMISELNDEAFRNYDETYTLEFINAETKTFLYSVDLRIAINTVTDLPYIVELMPVELEMELEINNINKIDEIEIKEMNIKCFVVKDAINAEIINITNYGEKYSETIDFRFPQNGVYELLVKVTLDANIFDDLVTMEYVFKNFPGATSVKSIEIFQLEEQTELNKRIVLITIIFIIVTILLSFDKEERIKKK